MRDFDAQWSKCPVEKRQRELREERERERQGRELRREEQLQSSQSWRTWAIGLIDERIDAALHLGGMICKPVGAVIGGERKYMHGQHDKIRAEIVALRDELKATTAKLHERLARLPVVKEFQPETVYYTGDVVVCDGATYQAKRDTGRPVTSDDWILLARAGRDGRDGLTPNLCGTFDARQTYARFDTVECDGSSYIARRDAPGLCPGDDWRLLAKRGLRGPIGERGERGRTGERGAPGEDGPEIISWIVDPVHYRLVPTLSNGKQGTAIELRGLFERFNEEAVLIAVDAAMKDAARNPKLLAGL